jgi:hypothetical protein
MECCICLTPITENQYMTNCNHIFHKSCLEKWLSKNHQNCPICRQMIQYCDTENLERFKFILITQSPIPQETIILRYDKRKICIITSFFTFLSGGVFIWNYILSTKDCDIYG